MGFRLTEILLDIHCTFCIVLKNAILFSSVKEFMQFTSQILVERTRTNERASVKEQGAVYSKSHLKLKKNIILLPNVGVIVVNVM